MRWLLSLLLLGIASVVQAVSHSGNRLLVLLDDLADKSKYSKYFQDIEGIGNLLLQFWNWCANSYVIIDRFFEVTYETAKSEKVTLFELGEKTYDHLLLLPTKSKGN